MSRTKLDILAVFIVVVGLSPERLYSETRTAADLTPEAVGKAINVAKDGDIVQLPEGRAVWTKGWNTGHWAKMKAITIQGAGIDKTVICDNRPTRDAGMMPFWLVGVEGKPFRVTGITFDGTGYPNAGVWDGMMAIIGNCKNFRIDHCKFKNADQMMKISGDTYGLIDHCYFHGMEYKGRLVQTIRYFGPGAANYRKPLSLGTTNALYFEDNEAHFSPEVVNPDGNNPWIVPSDGADRDPAQQDHQHATGDLSARHESGALWLPERRDLRQCVLGGRTQQLPAAVLHLHRRRGEHRLQQQSDGHDLQLPRDRTEE